MENNYSSTNLSAVSKRDLSLPHFDQEATLLSARPVVPLVEINARTNSTRHLIFGLTILIAILLGAISAMLLLQNTGNSQNAADSKDTQPILSSTGAAGGFNSEPGDVEIPVAGPEAEEHQVETVLSARSSSTRKRQPAISLSSTKPAVSRNSAKPARVRNPDYGRGEDFESDEWEVRRSERRNARREDRRRNRNRREQIGDDVLRIREIFEGSPRP